MMELFDTAEENLMSRIVKEYLSHARECMAQGQDVDIQKTLNAEIILGIMDNNRLTSRGLSPHTLSAFYWKILLGVIIDTWGYVENKKSRGSATTKEALLSNSIANLIPRVVACSSEENREVQIDRII